MAIVSSCVFESISLTASLDTSSMLIVDLAVSESIVNASQNFQRH